MQISQDAAVFRLPVHQADLHRCRSLANLFSEIFTEVRDSSGLSGPRVLGSRVLGSPGPLFIERLQGVWPKIIPVAMEMPIFYVNFSSLNYPNLNDESLEPYG